MKPLEPEEEREREREYTRTNRIHGTRNKKREQGMRDIREKLRGQISGGSVENGGMYLMDRTRDLVSCEGYRLVFQFVISRLDFLRRHTLAGLVLSPPPQSSTAPPSSLGEFCLAIRPLLLLLGTGRADVERESVEMATATRVQRNEVRIFFLLYEERE